MSYTTTIKNALMENPLTEERLVRAELSAIFSSEAHFSISSEITCRIETDSRALAGYIKEQIEKTYGLVGELSEKEITRFGKHTAFELIFNDAAEFLSATETVREGPFGFYNPVLNTIFEEDAAVQAAFLRGIFLGAGSVLDPRQRFHLEFDGLNAALIETCLELLESFGITVHTSKREDLYTKDAQSIADFLEIIGAEEAAETVEEQILLKQMRGEINRQVNCETANLKKIAVAADREIEAIESLIERGRFSTLDPKLQTAALMRLDAPELSITELAKNAQVSRSTLYRRLKQIVERAERERDEG